MPRVKQLEPQVPVPSTAGVPNASPGALTQGIRAYQVGLGQIMQGYRKGEVFGHGLIAEAVDIDQRLKNYDRYNQLQNLTFQAKQGLADAAMEASTNPDWRNNVSGFESTAEALKKSHLDQIKDPIVRQMYDRQWNTAYLHYHTAVKGQARKLQIKEFQGDLETRLDILEQQAAQVINDPEAIKGVISQAAGQLAAGVNAGLYDYDDAVKRWIKFRDNAWYGAARAYVFANPERAVEDIAKGTFPITDPKIKQALTELGVNRINSLIRRADHELNRQRVEEDRQVRFDQDQTDKEAQSLFSQGKWADLDKYLDERMNSRKIRPGTFSRFKTLLETKNLEDYKRNKEYLRQQFSKAIDPLTDPLGAKIANQTLANVLRTYDELYQQGMSPETASWKAGELGKRQDITRITPPPDLGLVGADKYDLGKVQGAMDRFKDKLKQEALLPVERRMSPLDVNLRIKVLLDLQRANKEWLYQAPSRDKEELAAIKHLQELENKAELQRQQNEQQRRQLLQGSGKK